MVRNHIVPGKIKGEAGAKGENIEWWPAAKCVENKLKVQTGDLGKADTMEDVQLRLDASIYKGVDREITNDLLAALLKENKAGTLKKSELTALAAEVSKGECLLCLHKGKLVRVVDEVLIALTGPI